MADPSRGGHAPHLFIAEFALAVGAVAVVAQEELFQGRRLADQAAHARVAERPDEFAEAFAVDVGAQRGAVDADIFDAADSGEIAWVAEQFGFDRRAAEMPHRVQRPALDGLAGADDRHPFAECLGLGQDVTGQQDRRATVARFGDALLKDVLHQGVQAAARLVEEQQPGARREGRDQRDLLPVALGVGARLLVRVEFEALDQLGAALFVDAAAHAGQQVDGLAAGQIRPQRDIAGNIGDLAV